MNRHKIFFVNAGSNVTSKILSVLPPEDISVILHCGGSLLLLFFYLRLTNNDKNTLFGAVLIRAI